MSLNNVETCGGLSWNSYRPHCFDRIDGNWGFGHCISCEVISKSTRVHTWKPFIWIAPGALCRVSAMDCILGQRTQVEVINGQKLFWQTGMIKWAENTFLKRFLLAFLQFEVQPRFCCMIIPRIFFRFPLKNQPIQPVSKLGSMVNGENVALLHIKGTTICQEQLVEKLVARYIFASSAKCNRAESTTFAMSIM